MQHPTFMAPTATTGTTTITTELISLLWLASPALPVGGFSYSEGLEGAVDTGILTDEASVSTWLCDQLHLSLSRSDLAVVSLAVNASRAHDAAKLQALDDWVIQSRETAELRLQTEQMGKSFAQWSAPLHGPQAFAARSYPVSFAQTAARIAPSASAHDIATAYGFSWCEAMIAAAVRAVPLGQSAGQRLLQTLSTELPNAVQSACSREIDELQAFTPMLAIASSQHEHQYSRLFRS